MRMVFSFFMMWVAVIALASSARAQDDSADYARSFAALAAEYGCPQLTRNTLDELSDSNAGQAESKNISFVPSGESDTQFTRKFTAVASRLPNDPNEARRMLGYQISFFVDMIEQHGIVLEKKDMTDADGEPMMYIEYSIGEIPDTVYAAGVIARQFGGLVSFTEIKGKTPLDVETRTRMKEYAQSLTKKASQ